MRFNNLSKNDLEKIAFQIKDHLTSGINKTPDCRREQIESAKALMTKVIKDYLESQMSEEVKKYFKDNPMRESWARVTCGSIEVGSFKVTGPALVELPEEYKHLCKKYVDMLDTIPSLNTSYITRALKEVRSWEEIEELFPELNQAWKRIKNSASNKQPYLNKLKNTIKNIKMNNSIDALQREIENLNARNPN